MMFIFSCLYGFVLFGIFRGISLQLINHNKLITLLLNYEKISWP